MLDALSPSTAYHHVITFAEYQVLQEFYTLLLSVEGPYGPIDRSSGAGPGWLALSEKFVRACTRNPVNWSWCNFYYCLLLWSSCAKLSMGKIGHPLHGFQGGSKFFRNGDESTASSSASWLLLPWHWVNCRCCVLLVHGFYFPDQRGSWNWQMGSHQNQVASSV